MIWRDFLEIPTVYQIRYAEKEEEASYYKIIVTRNCVDEPEKDYDIYLTENGGLHKVLMALPDEEKKQEMHAIFDLYQLTWGVGEIQFYFRFDLIKEACGHYLNALLLLFQLTDLNKKYCFWSLDYEQKSIHDLQSGVDWGSKDKGQYVSYGGKLYKQIT